MDFDPSHASREQTQAILSNTDCGHSDAVNKHVYMVLSSNKRYGLTKRIARRAEEVKFPYDGWLVIYRYPGDSDVEAIMRHHLRYNAGFRSEEYEMYYSGEPSVDFEFSYPPDDRQPEKCTAIDDNFCGLRGWGQLLSDRLPPTARHFSVEQESMYLIKAKQYVWVINYEYS
jgi:hypothetical protein